MRLARPILIAVLAIPLVVAMLASSIAQDTSAKGEWRCAHETAHYVDLGFWDKVRLGTAYFVNSELVKSSDIVYKFDLNSFDKVEDARRLELLLANHDWVAAIDKGGAYVCDPSIGPDKIETLLNDPQLYGKVVILSKEDELLGAEPSGAVVNWGRPR